MRYFERLRENPAGYIAMFIGAILPMPVDLFISNMTIGESIGTRIWFIVAKTMMGGPYDRFRDWLLTVSRPNLDRITHTERLQRAIIDAPCYCVFHVSLYTAAVVVQVGARLLLGFDSNLVHGLNGIAFVAVFTFVFGPLFGLLLDTLKAAIERIKKDIS